MFRRLPATFIQAACAFLLGAVSTYGVVTSVQNSVKLSEISEIQSDSNISDSIDYTARRTIETSRRSTVNVMSMSVYGTISSSSGTYIKVGDRFYILTVAHGIIGPCELVRIRTGGDMVECVEYTIVDMHLDYALIEVEAIDSRVAVEVPASTPKNRDWDDALSIHNEVYYTGYPNGIGPFTLDGKIIGYDSSEYVYLHSFAWPGSSGSGVFNERGELIGYVMAISVGATEYGVDVLEDVVIVAPLYKIDWNVVQ